MNSLFSVFDPQAAMSLPLNWIAALTALLSLPPIYWARSSTLSKLVSLLMKHISSEFNAILGSISAPGLSLLPASMFLFILLNNSSGLLPYTFTSSSHMTFTLTLAFPLWVGHMVMGWMKTYNSMLAHLVPMGTPGPLMPLMVMIEITSSMIRPFTLAVRLAANMIAGHLLLTLLGGLAEHSSHSTIWMVLGGLATLMALEVAVALIQSYVFSVLSTLYLSEVNSPKLS